MRFARELQQFFPSLQDRSSKPPRAFDLEIAVETIDRVVWVRCNQRPNLAMRAVVFLGHGRSHNVSYYYSTHNLV